MINKSPLTGKLCHKTVAGEVVSLKEVLCSAPRSMYVVHIQLPSLDRFEYYGQSHLDCKQAHEDYRVNHVLIDISDALFAEYFLLTSNCVSDKLVDIPADTYCF